MKILFPTFLEDPRVYRLAQAWWRRLFDRLFADQGISYQPFYKKTTATGKPLYDGNPIFDAYFPTRHKLVRILQFVPEPGDRLLTAWVDEVPVEMMEEALRPSPADRGREGEAVKELVIVVALTQKSIDWLEDLFKEWVIHNRKTEEMQSFLEKI